MTGERDEKEPTDPSADPELEKLLEYLKLERNIDFTGYKRTTLARRIQKRVDETHSGGYEGYLSYMVSHPEEFTELFNTILINVTSFFRDPAVWEVLRSDIIPRIIAGKAPDEPIRAWSAGCASGEEAYSLAMLLADALDPEQLHGAKIYATDADDEALTVARQGIFTGRDVANIPEDLAAKYVEHMGNRFTFRDGLRRTLIFGRHNIVEDAPISKLDLLVCRNVLMYFTQETQRKALANFHFALGDTGFLLLGKAESLLTQSDLFAPENIKFRLFRKRDRGRRNLPAPEPSAPAPETSSDALVSIAFDLTPIPQIVLAANGNIVMSNTAARAAFGVKDGVNRSLQDFDLGENAIGLQRQVREAIRGQRPLVLRGLELTNMDGTTRMFDVEVIPLASKKGGAPGAGVTFKDVTDYRALVADHEHSRSELQTAYEELQSANEELETSNEEIQSTVEELETTNEELQSSNEELETMNEELQAANEELQTMNEEIRLRSDEMDRSTVFTDSILSSIEAGVLVLDRDLRVQVWSGHLEEMWGLRAEEVTRQALLNLDIGLPVGRLVGPIGRCLAGETDRDEIELDAVNRRGKPVKCRITFSPLIDDKQIEGVVLLIHSTERA